MKQLQHVDTLWRLINMAGNVRDMAQETVNYVFAVAPPVTFYLDAESASVLVRRHALPEILVEATYQAGFGWKVQTDQNDDGVYLVAKRRLLVGTLSRVTFVVTVPHDTFVILKLENGSLALADIDGEWHIPPAHTTQPTTLKRT
jgi:hypothetical protein